MYHLLPSLRENKVAGHAVFQFLFLKTVLQKSSTDILEKANQIKIECFWGS